MATFIDDARTLELARELAPMTHGTILGPKVSGTWLGHAHDSLTTCEKCVNSHTAPNRF